MFDGADNQNTKSTAARAHYVYLHMAFRTKSKERKLELRAEDRQGLVPFLHQCHNNLSRVHIKRGPKPKLDSFAKYSEVLASCGRFPVQVAPSLPAPKAHSCKEFSNTARMLSGSIEAG